MKKTLLMLPLALLTVALSACGQGGGDVDTTNPTVTLASVPSPVTVAGAVNVSARASDDAGIRQVEFYLDDAAAPFATDTSADASQNYTASLNWTAAQNGTHIIRVVAVDTSGNRSSQATQTVTVNIDDVPPVVTVTGLPTGSVTTASTYTIGYSATDNVGVTSVRGVLTRRDAAGATTTIGQKATTATSDTISLYVDAALNGTYTLTVTATDAAGNVGTKTQTVVVDIPTSSTPAPTPTPTPTPTPPADTTAPTLEIMLPANPITVAGNYNVTVRAYDNVGVTSLSGVLSLPGGLQYPLTFNATGGTQSIPVTSAYNGTSTLTVTARDAAGNTTTRTAQVTVNIP